MRRPPVLRSTDTTKRSFPDHPDGESSERFLWALSLAATIFIMTPVYNGRIDLNVGLPAQFRESGFLQTMGTMSTLWDFTDGTTRSGIWR